MIYSKNTHKNFFTYRQNSFLISKINGYFVGYPTFLQKTGGASMVLHLHLKKTLPYRVSFKNTDYSICHPEKSNRYVNCMMWTFLSRQKNKLFYDFEKGTPFFEYSFRSVADYIDDDNNRRIQTKTNWMSPSEFRKAPMMAI